MPYTSNFKLQTSNFKLQTLNFELQTFDFRDFIYLWNLKFEILEI
jgi:hypothetical protein